MRLRELSTWMTPFYKIFPIIIVAILGTPVFSMFVHPESWHCHQDFKKITCSQMKQSDIPFIGFSKTISSDEKQAAFYSTRDLSLLLFIVFFGLTFYIAWIVKRVQILGDQVIISDYIRTVKVPAHLIAKVQINSFPGGTITLRFNEPIVFGNAVTFGVKTGFFLYYTEQTVKDLHDSITSSTSNFTNTNSQQCDTKKPLD